MFKFITKVILLGIIFLITLFIINFITTEGLKKNTSNVYDVWNKIYKGEINSKLIINGSSIAEVQISPQIIDSTLSTTSYNFGMSGYSFLMQKARYDVFLEHNKQPDIIIQIVGDGTFCKKEGLFQLSQFLPYLDDPIITNATQKYEGLTFSDYNIPFFKYSGKFKTITKGVASFCNVEFLTSNRYKGYASNNVKWDSRFDDFKEENPNGKKIDISDTIVSLFESYLYTETQKGTKIILVFTPTFTELEKYMLNRNKVINLYKSISKKHNILFLDYSKSDFTMSKELFYNANHLNKKGAELFTKKLALDIKAQLPTKN